MQITQFSVAMRRIFPIFVLFLAGCPAEAPREAAPPPTEAVDWAAAFDHEVRYDAAKKAVVVDVKIAPGFHAYTVGETTGRPLKLSVDDPWKLGDVAYPKGLAKNLPIGKSVIVEGSASVVGPVTAPEAPPAQITGKFAYQVCTDEACDRPRSAKFAVKPE